MRRQYFCRVGPNYLGYFKGKMGRKQRKHAKHDHLQRFLILFFFHFFHLFISDEETGGG